jgi:ATP-dependent Zn protease
MIIFTKEIEKEVKNIIEECAERTREYIGKHNEKIEM